MDSQTPDAEALGALLTAEQIAKLTTWALYPNEGDAVPFGTRELMRQFASIDTEQAITNRVLQLAHTYPGATLADVFAVAQAELLEVAAWILADYDADGDAGEHPDAAAALAWIRNRKNKVTTAQVIGLVLGQVELHDQALILGKALLASGLLEALAGATTSTHRPTSSATA
jgi:hypothetical protein